MAGLDPIQNRIGSLNNKVRNDTNRFSGGFVNSKGDNFNTEVFGQRLKKKKKKKKNEGLIDEKSSSDEFLRNPFNFFSRILG